MKRNSRNFMSLICAASYHSLPNGGLASARVTGWSVCRPVGDSGIICLHMSSIHQAFVLLKYVTLSVPMTDHELDPPY